MLALLLEHPGEIVTREELQSRLWPAGTFVDFDHGLGSAVGKLRQALGDSAQNPRFVETLGSRGYRFIAPVTEMEQDSIPSTVESRRPPAQLPAVGSAGLIPPGRPPRWRVWLIGGVAAAAALAAALTALNVGGWRDRLLGPGGQISALAVLPLENLSHDPEQEYFADGMTDELITSLGQIGALRVISRTSVMRYKGGRKPLAEIARDLNVDAVVEGTILRSGNRVRITAQLIRVNPEAHLWAESYERDLKDALALQSDVAQDIAQQIQIKVTPNERQRLQRAVAVDPEARDAAELGKFHLDKGTQAELDSAAGYFRQAIQKDPGYAAAHVGLAETYLARTPIYSSPRETMPPARQALLKALELDNGLAEAHAALASVLLAYDWDWKAAEQEIQRALELDPSSALAHENYAAYYSSLGRSEDAAREMRRNLELDPLSVGAGTVSDNVWTLYMAHQFDRAAEQCRKDLEISPDYGEASNVLGLVSLVQGQKQQALAQALKGAQLDSNTFDVELLGAVEAGLGMRSEVNALLASLKQRSRNEYVCLYELGVIYAAMNQKDAAFSYLTKATASRDICMIWLKVDPRLESLHSDVRFQDLVHQIGFP